MRADVARHDDDGVAEVDGTALCVGEAAVVEHLQEGVEHVGVSLSISSKRTTEYGFRRTASVSMTTLLEAGGRTRMWLPCPQSPRNIRRAGPASIRSQAATAVSGAPPGGTERPGDLA